MPEGAFYETTWLPDRNANTTITVPMDSKLYREYGAQLMGEAVCSFQNTNVDI